MTIRGGYRVEKVTQTFTALKNGFEMLLKVKIIVPHRARDGFFFLNRVPILLVRLTLVLQVLNCHISDTSRITVLKDN
jgi:hypothetical protein